MRSYFVVLSLLLLAAPCFADAGPHWLEVKSAHFTVYTDGSDRQARHTAGQLERMHAVLSRLLPGSHDDVGSVMDVLAFRDRKGFQTVEPAAYLSKGALDVAGLFLRGEDRNYILLRLDNTGDHPYEVVYHEYTHYIVRHAEYLPVWLNEGLAQFYQNTDIYDSEVRLGRPNANELLFLRQQKLIPLETLFAVGQDSPYYHDQDKGSIFYGESWALTHLLFMQDFGRPQNRLKTYAGFLIKGESPLAAARDAFGDLAVLQKQLQLYVDQGDYKELKMAFPISVDEKALDVHPIPTYQADALRADVLARDGRMAEAESLAQAVLAQAPDSPIAHECMGLIRMRAGDLAAAAREYAQAVALHSTSYLAFYYAGSLALQHPAADSTPAAADLRESIRLNPHFAPSLESLAEYESSENRDLDEALTLALRAVTEDPGNLNYRLNAIQIRVQRKEFASAISGLRATLALAHTDEERTRVQTRLQQVERYQTSMTQTGALQAESHAEMAAAASQPPASSTLRDAHGRVVHAVVLKEPDHKLPDGPPSGPKHTISGAVQNVGCFYPKGMTLQIEGLHSVVSLYSNDIYAIAYTAGNFTPTTDLNPCQDFSGLKARVTYTEVTDPSVQGQIVSMELNH